MKNKSILKLLSLVFIVTLFITGCGCNKKEQASDNEKINNQTNEEKNIVEEVLTRYIESVEKRVEINSHSKPTEDDITEGVYTIEELKDKKVVLKEKMPNSGWVRVDDNKKVIYYSLIVDSYTANKHINKIEITKGTNTRIKPENK